MMSTSNREVVTEKQEGLPHWGMEEAVGWVSLIPLCNA